MSYKLYYGNVLDTKCRIIGHGVNCKGVFGSGVAKSIADVYPEVRKKYLLRYNRGGWKLGEVQIVEIPASNMWFVNMATQESYGREPNKVYVDYPSVGICLNKLLSFAEGNGLDCVAIPKIGCGLAGGDWKIVEKIIQECVQGRKIDLEVWEYNASL